MTTSTSIKLSVQDQNPNPEQKEGRRERNKREKFNRIVSAARTLFRTRGYEETRTQDIADGADVGSGTLFLYAKSKEDLLVLVFLDEMHEIIDRVFREVPHNEMLLTQITSAFTGIVDYHNRDFTTSGILIRELCFLQNRKRQADIFVIQEKISQHLVNLIEAAKLQGEIRQGVDSLTAARTLFSTYFTQQTFWLGGYTSIASFKRELQKLLSMIVDGMKVAPGSISS